MPYSSRHSDTIARLITQQGQAAADARLNSGAAWGQAIQGIGQTVDRSLAGLIRQREEAPQRELEQMQLQEQREGIAARKAMQAENAAFGRLLNDSLTQDPETGRPTVDRKRLFSSVPPELQHRLPDIIAMLDKVDPPKEQFTLNPGDVRFDASGKQVASVVKPPDPFTLTPGAVRFGPDGQQVASAPAAPRAPVSVAPGGRLIDPTTGAIVAEGAPQREPQGPQPAWQWVNRGGAPVHTNRPQPGDEPLRAPQNTGDTAQDRQRNARTQAARDFLKRLNELRTKINTKMGPAAGATGLARRAGAALGMDPDVAEYERIRAAGGRSLAVAIMGAQNLSDADASAWANMLPDARTDEETAGRLTTQVESMLEGMTGSGAAPAPPPVTPPTPAAPKATPTVGSTVTWQGKRYKVKAITNGQAELEPLP